MYSDVLSEMHKLRHDDEQRSQLLMRYLRLTDKQTRLRRPQTSMKLCGGYTEMDKSETYKFCITKKKKQRGFLKQFKKKWELLHQSNESNT